MQPMREGQASYAHVNGIVTGLRRRGWSVRLVQPPLPRPGGSDGLRRAIAAATLQLRFWLSCRFRPAPVVYVRTHFLTLPSAILARLAGATVVQEMNSPIDDGYDAWPQLRKIGPIISLAYRAQLRMADLVIAVTPGLVTYVRDFAGRRGETVVVGNGADTQLFRPADDRATDSSARPYAVFAGALASWQGIDTVLAATEDPAWPDQLDLVVAGDGKERDQLEAAVARSSRVRWLGSIPYAEAAELVSRSAVSLVPKNSLPLAGFGLSPLKLFEGMACGVPVVVSDLPGIAEIVQATGCGVVFPAGDAGALARAVAQVVGDPAAAREMGERGRAAAIAEYSWDARGGQTAAAMDAVLTRRRAR